DAGFDCLEHATGLTGATIARAAEAGVPVVTTLVNVDEFETYASQGERKFPGYATHMRRLRAGRLDRTRDAVDAGVVLLAGTDSGGVLGHGIIHDELAELARAGLTGTQILEAAAWAPRSILRAPGLEDGAAADLLVVPREARDAGVGRRAGTDPGGVPGHAIIHDELDDRARAGLTGTRILEAAAWAPRSSLRAPGLEDGAPADLLVVPRDPRRDHRALR